MNSRTSHEPSRLIYARWNSFFRGSLSSMKGQYYVYILASRSRVLYTGITNDMERRVIEHRSANTDTFAGKYRVYELVHMESYSEITQAIAREKQIKGWTRAKRIALIEEKNPDWRALAAYLPRRNPYDQ